MYNGADIVYVFEDGRHNSVLYLDNSLTFVPKNMIT